MFTMLSYLPFKDVIGIFIAVALLTITYFKLSFSYWKKRNVPQLETSIPFGNAQNPFKIKQPFYLTVESYYKRFKAQGHPHGGIYMSTKPIYMPVDPDYVKNIMSTDFQHFFDRGTYSNEKADPLSGHLFNLEGQKWRNLRAKLTPTFTPAKMKMMFQTLMGCGHQMMDELERLTFKGEAVDIKEILGCYSTDVIGSCAFGLDCNSFKIPDAEFRRNGRNIFKPTFKRKMRVFFATTFPTVCRLLGIVFIPKDVSTFFMDVVRKMIEYRETNNVRRNDFMQILLDMKDDGGTNGLTVEQMAAQAFVFFIAGFETAATTMNFCLFELAQNEDIQVKIRNEIEAVLERYNGEVTYDAIVDLKYLEQVVNETLRKYPPAPHLSRKCTKEYRIPGTDIILEKDRKVFISILGLHRDPEYYPNPDIFDPDRFSEENKATRHQFTFLPFGEGPRNCIGARFGMMQTKVGLCLILRSYRIGLSPKTELPLTLEPTALLMTTKNKIWLDMEKLSSS